MENIRNIKEDIEDIGNQKEYGSGKLECIEHGNIIVKLNGRIDI
jgi:hypothetical protein